MSMDNVQIVKEITNAFCENRVDEQLLSRYFAPDFQHVANGRKEDLKGFSKRLTGYMSEYARFRIPNWDELFESGEKVVASYTLEGEKRNGEKDTMSVMAVWKLNNGKVTSIREVDAATEN